MCNSHEVILFSYTFLIYSFILVHKGLITKTCDNMSREKQINIWLFHGTSETFDIL